MYEYIIIGAGTAGCVLANRLSEDPGNRVLLLEAGGQDDHPLVRMPVGFMKALNRRELTWGYESEPESELLGRKVPLPRGRLLGGSSSINGMFHIRGHRLDFDEWRDLGCEGWGYEDVLPYFIRSETSWRGAGRFHGGEGPLQVRPINTKHLLEEPLRDACLNAGHVHTQDYDGEQQEGFARGEVAIDQRGRRSSSARAFLRPVLNRPNLKVITQAEVTRIVIVDNVAQGVEFRHQGTLQQVRALKEVIVSAGAYNSPKLLMLSGIGPEAHLQSLGIPVHQNLPGVGQNLMEHPRMMLMYKANGPITFNNQLRLDRATWSAINWAVRGKGTFANQISNGTVLLKTRADLDRPDIQLLCNPVRFDANLWFPGLVAPKEDSFYVTVCLLRAKSRGQVTLRSATPSEAPKVELRLFSAPEDFETMRNGLRAARSIYASRPIADLIECETIPGGDVQSDEAIDQAIREFGGITHHPVGTCAMGVGECAVVDPALRVYGIRNLRVADASIMPRIPGANTNAATVMIGEKAADLIRYGASYQAVKPVPDAALT